MNKNTKVIYKRIEESFYEKGYINLNHRLVNTRDDLVEIASIFRDERYETFRVVFMKNNSIVGYESITSRVPNKVSVVKPDKRGIKNSERCFNKFYSRMNRLSADGYYLVHNHPSDNAQASNEDVLATLEFAKRVKGFKGHLIVNTDSYAWISIDKDGIPQREDHVPVNKEKVSEIQELLKEKSIYDVKILSREDFISIMHNIKNSKDYSIAILTNGQGRVKMILDIPNRMVNMPKDEFKNYFINLAKMNGVTRVFFATDNEDVLEKAKEHLEYGTIKDLMFYQKHKTKGLMTINEFKCDCGTELFDNSFSGIFKEDEEEYDSEPKRKLRILMKRVNQEPEEMEIEDTLEAKQALVDGLIEVVYVSDGLLLICNEEGKLDGLLPNLVFEFDYIAGDCFFIGDDYENGDFKSLTDEQIEEVKELCEKHKFVYLYDLDEKGDDVDGR